MQIKKFIGPSLAGAAAGAVNGLFGGGGGMVLIPVLRLFPQPENRDIFASSVAIILPICLVSLAGNALSGTGNFADALPWLPGSAVGGYLAARYRDRIPDIWLHRGLGILILYGGLRYLW